MFGEKYLVLREEFIVHQTPTEDWLVDLENQQNYKLTGLDSAMFEMLDGSWSRNGIIKQITEGMEAEADEIKHIQKAVCEFLELYSFAISEKEEKKQRSQIYYGEKEYYLPNEIGIEMTNKCVLSCLHCYKECSNDKNTYLNYNHLMRFLEKLSGKVSTIQITGGEAMLHPHFFDVLRYCKENFKRVCVSTTGALIDKNNIKYFIGTHVYLSLYSFNQAENTRYSGGNVYSKIMSAIKMLVDNNVHVCINTIVNERNKNEFEGFVNQAVALGVQGIGAGKVTRVGRGKNLNEEEYCRKESEQQVAAIERNFDVEGVYLSTFVENGEGEKLQCGFHKWFISENGRVLPCTFFPEDIFYIGTLESDIREIFNVDKFEEMKEKLKAWGKELNMEGIKMCEVCGALRELEND